MWRRASGRDPVERRLREAFGRGVEVDLTDVAGPVRAEVLADLLAEPGSPSRAALRLRGARVVGRLDLRNVSVGVPVRFEGCEFDDVPELTEAVLVNLVLRGCVLPGLSARLAEVRGDLTLAGCEVGGLVDLRDARIGGNLDLDGATLRRPGGVALDGDRLAVTGNLTARYGCTVHGELLLVHARIGSQLNLTGAWLRNPGGFVLNLGGAQVRSLWLTFAERPEGRVRLSGVQAESIFDYPASWPPELDLIGCTYKLLIAREPGGPGEPLPLVPVSVRQRLDWLRRSPEGYVPQPYEQLAEAYRRGGQEVEARRVLLERQRRRRATLRLPGRILGHLLDGLVGYGYRTWLAGIWLVGFWVLGAVSFALDPSVPRNPAEAPTRNPVLQALDLLLPIVNLGHDNAWKPSGATEYVAALLVLAGWVLTTAVVAGLTRTLNR
ncbi:hypothetical protein [Plantactinospora sonchi]|uniref:Membrane-associated oxidoreductase n=1 Tax=Plantactinospora sonchi TaxID=1544735 RepID=A0ABU7RLI7_9ACTN